MTDKEGIECIFFTQIHLSCFQIYSDFLNSEIGQINRPYFSSFSTNTEFTGVEIDGGFIERGQFGNTQTSRVDAFYNRRIPFSLNRRGIDPIKNPDDFRGIQKSHFAIFLFDEINTYWINGFVSSFPAKLQKSTESDHICVRRLHR